MNGLKRDEKGLATAVTYIVKNVFRKLNVFKRHRQVVRIGFRF